MKPAPDAPDELDPVAIREALVTSRKAERSWEDAWLAAVGYGRSGIAPDGHSLYAFIERHFEAAYHNAPSSLGRLKVPELDVSAAIGRLHVSVPSNRERCRSGDGCDHLATRGTFGQHWCERHGEELERLSVKLRATWGDTYGASVRRARHDGHSARKDESHR
jgi:hypothetical protein